MNQANQASGQQRAFGMKDKLAYMAGDMANDFSFIMSANFLMLFYINVLKIEGYIVGILFLLARVVDGFTDIGMGRIVDTIKPYPEGRFRGLIRRAAPFVCFSGFLLFLHIVKDWDYSYKIIYIFVTYIFWGSFAYTAVNIPYGSMATVISAKVEDRSSLSVYRTVGANIAVLVISFGIPLLVYREIDGKQEIIPEMFTYIMGAFMIIAFIFYQVCWRYSTERIQLEPETPKEKKHCFEDIQAIFRNLVSNFALQIFILVAIFLLLATLLVNAMNPYLYVDYFNSKFALSIGGVFAPIAIFAIAPFAQRWVKAYGKKESASVALLMSSIIYFALYFFHITNVWVYLAFVFVALLGVGYFNVIVWAFITDVIDQQFLKTNKREDGTIYATYSFARKLGQALAGGLGGVALSLVGYQSHVSVQSQEVLDSIYSFSNLAPAIFYLIIAILLKFVYPLSKDVVLKNSEALEELSKK
ncbi:sugar (glycoside-Pentoside-hexuronide) transporter [Actinobacillus seminis]|uniref:Sugar (Glycoside-Pentoside-hexuronide) transporter n=2 Tax=Actinobacillus seminis TaxID=722 RepID=A0A380VG78_9PAST|nr:glycoside-pentoside-hexuronide (GPH):cation symporter [Actinobacillus seminis]SUU37577.1 sugar (glycoside-Pentoside-hexuronide) transporter [Actinobacillus seminis]